MAQKKRKKTGGRQKGPPTVVIRICKSFETLATKMNEEHKKLWKEENSKLLIQEHKKRLSDGK